jgi:hypothetical protein
MSMPASARRQLNIRNDEAFATAHELARELSTTTAEIVVRALREFKSKRRIPSRLVTPEEADANIAALRKRWSEYGPGDLGGLSSNHDDLYDDYGLPK